MDNPTPNEYNIGTTTQSLQDAMNDKVDFSGIAGKKILWVEDDQFLNFIITKKLALAKCISLHANDGEAALRIASNEIPDVIVLDIILPGMDGFEIIRKLKADPKTKNIPVIFLSNLGQASDIEKGKSLGALRYIVKATVTPNEILKQISEVVGSSKK